MTYDLVEVRSLGSGGHGFCLPIFSTKGSNDAYAQNLDSSGRIIEFLPVDADQFSKIEKLPPPLATDVGLKGFLAYIHDDGSLFVLPQEELRGVLSGLDISDPFVALEVSALLDDKSLQRSAIKECTAILGEDGAISRWAKRERKLFRASEKLLEKEASDQSPPEDQYAEEFLALERDFASEEWTERWIKLWGQGYRRKELTGLAGLRIDQGFSFGSDGARIFDLIIDFDKSDFVLNHSIQALEKSRITDESWRSLFIKLGHYSYRHRQNMSEIARAGLEAELREISSASRAWVSLWSMIYGYGNHDREALRLASEYVDRIPSLSAESARVLIYPFRKHDTYFEPFYQKARDWVLQYPRSTVVWSALYLKVLERDKSDEVIQMGERWLAELGGNLTSWVDVWSRFHGLIDESFRRKLAIDWLGRARWDMRAWVDLFLLLFENASPGERKELHSLGTSWLRAGYGSRANYRRVEQTVRYLDSLPSR